MRKVRSLALAALAGLGIAALPARASTIIGYLGNFDVTNDTGAPTDDFELHLPGVSTGNILYTWNSNPHYHAPVISPEAGGTFVHYVSPTADVTPNGGVEHFGVALPTFPTGLTYQWSRGGTPVGTPTLFPHPVVTIVPTPPTPESPEGGEAIQIEIWNESGEVFHVERAETHLDREVELTELMIDDPIIAGATWLDDKPKELRPGKKLFDDNPTGLDDLRASSVMALRIYADDDGHAGRFLGTFMTAAITAPVPEPTSFAILGLASAGALARRRRA